MGWDDWVDYDFSIVRGLAYYTGTVFEVLAEGERAVAGGGRYDDLVELFGGPRRRRWALRWAMWCSPTCSRIKRADAFVTKS